jgi:hypothetical protein
MNPRPAMRSLYDPPRAGRLRGMWDTWYAFRRRSRLPLVDIPALPATGITWRRILLVLVPGYAWTAARGRAIARGAIAAYVVSTVVLLLGLGWPIAGWAAGVMMTVHGLGVAEYFYSGRVFERPNHRVARYIAVLLLSAAGYTLTSRVVLASFVVPLQTGHETVLINPRARVTTAARGERIAFHRERWRSGHFVIPGGVFLGTVLALPGDTIVFQADRFLLNGKAQPRRPGMARQGQLVVPAAHRFVWPSDLRREIGEEPAAWSFATTMALVPDEMALGRPYHRWFFRVQTP